MSEFVLRRSDLQRSSYDLSAPIRQDVAKPPVAAKASPTPLRFRVVLTAGEMSALRAEWNALFALAGRPEQVFQTFAWNWTWCQHYLSHGRFKRGPKLAVITGRSQGRLVLVLPLVIERVAGLAQLSWMGEPVSQYGDVLATPEAAELSTLAAAWDFAVKATRADLAKLRKVRADAIVAPLLATLGAAVTATEEAPYLDFTRAADFTAYEAGLPAKGRKNRRRHMRRLGERGTVAFEQHSGDRDAAHLADYAVLQKRAWLRLRDRISLAMADDRFRAFFADIAGAHHDGMGCKVLALRSQNEITALQILLECKGQRFLHVAVYGSKFEKLGVGGLLLEHALGDCAKDGIQRLDLLAPKHEYKMEFADGTVAINDHALALTMGGRAYAMAYLGMRRKLKAAVEAMPAPARRLIANAIAVLKR